MKAKLFLVIGLLLLFIIPSLQATTINDGILTPTQLTLSIIVNNIGNWSSDRPNYVNYSVFNTVGNFSSVASKVCYSNGTNCQGTGNGTVTSITSGIFMSFPTITTTGTINLNSLALNTSLDTRYLVYLRDNIKLTFNTANTTGMLYNSTTGHLQLDGVVQIGNNTVVNLLLRAGGFDKTSGGTYAFGLNDNVNFTQLLLGHANTTIGYLDVSGTGAAGELFIQTLSAQGATKFGAIGIFPEITLTSTIGNSSLIWGNLFVSNANITGTLNASRLAGKLDYQDILNPPWINSTIGVPTGGIMLWATTTAPTGWLIANGSNVSRTTFSALFAIIGTTFGAGDGSTTFTLPDFKQRFPLGKASSGIGSTIGNTGGKINHTHGIDPPSTVTSTGTTTVAATPLLGTASAATHTHTVDIANFSSSGEDPPYLTINYIIKT